jgi:hypothetical protein
MITLSGVGLRTDCTKCQNTGVCWVVDPQTFIFVQARCSRCAGNTLHRSVFHWDTIDWSTFR